MRIGITDPMGADDRYQSYVRWLSSWAPGAQLVRLSCRLDNAAEADACGGIILTGGGDVDPALYRGPVGHPTLSGVDRQRDLYERQVMDRVVRRPRPFLGICRGMQFVNVYFGGTLLPDIEEAGYRSHRSSAGPESLHPLAIAGTGQLARSGVSTGDRANTYHHQAVAAIGAGLAVAATADDGIVEALESPAAEEFFLLVQWHPERMRDQSSPAAGRIAEQFVSACARFAGEELTFHSHPIPGVDHDEA